MELTNRLHLVFQCLHGMLQETFAFSKSALSSVGSGVEVSRLREVLVLVISLLFVKG
jgi:hypothetical protein